MVDSYFHMHYCKYDDTHHKSIILLNNIHKDYFVWKKTTSLYTAVQTATLPTYF